MPNSIPNPQIRSSATLSEHDVKSIRALESLCAAHDGVALKLELEYKLTDTADSAEPAKASKRNEFLYFAGDRLIGYLGICSFGGTDQLELNGMVHPDYRRQGVFSQLSSMAVEECKGRKATGILLLCDRNAAAGQAFVHKIGGVYKVSEYEMVLNPAAFAAGAVTMRGLSLQKADSADAALLARMDMLCFGGREPAAKDDQMKVRLPEEEEKRGLTMYRAIVDGQTVGKVNLQLLPGFAGIYGLCVLPEYRGRGYGRAILTGAVRLLMQRGADTILLQVEAGNQTALSLYQSCGFQQTSVMDYYTLSV